MIWYSVPFIGERSRAAARFAGKFLCRSGMGAWVLDPRFPEVREFLASTYETAVRDWNLDGLKLDFIDRFQTPDPDPAAAENWSGRDIRSVPEAVLALMTEVRRRLEAVRPGILIEFRQSYMGPAIRSFGNMIRAGDVPGDPLRNRARTARLRLTSGTTAVHSDMLEWNPRETPQQAAQQILSVLFSVIQYSMRLDRLPADHRRMMKHWIAWTAAHRDALLRGSFSPRSPELGFPLLEGASDAERVVAVYDPGFVATVPADGRETWIVNATDAAELALDLAAAPASDEAFDTFGDPAPASLPDAGLRRVAVPPSGLLRLRFPGWRRVAFVAAAAFLVVRFVLTPSLVRGESMEPTYPRRGVNAVARWRFWFRGPRRGEVVVLRWRGRTTLLKRVLAFAGETVEFRDGVCYVDGDASEWTDDDIVADRGDMKLSMKYDEKFVYFMVKKDGLNIDKDKIYIPLDITPKSGSSYYEEKNMLFDRAVDFRQHRTIYGARLA